jgi:NADPH:quinone reductase-like Zn-dependent oxidoreductase
MRAIRIRQPASLESLELTTADAPAPGPAEVKVRIRAASLNFRDALVINGFFAVSDGLIPLSDGAGVVEVGEGVTLFKPDDRVVSVFHPFWLEGHRERAELVARSP